MNIESYRDLKVWQNGLLRSLEREPNLIPDSRNLKPVETA